jgi:hypothetical protein
MAAPQVRKRSQPADVNYDIAEEEEYYVTRPHTSVRRYRQPVERDTLDYDADEQPRPYQHRRASSPAIAGRNVAVRTTNPPISTSGRNRRRVPWLLLVLCTLMILGLIAGFGAVGSWWQTHQDDATYGRPRTYQVNAVVGHQDSASNPSHFIFMNLNRHIIIVEFPGGDAAHALVYTGPTLFGDGGDLIPVTGELKDVNGDHRPDMLVHIQDQTLVFINTGSKFRPLQPGEQINL